MIIPGKGVPMVEKFTSSGTWTNPGGITQIWLKACAGGGGGNASYQTQGGQKGASWNLPLTISGDLSITIGAGGTSGNDGGDTVIATGASLTLKGGRAGLGQGASSYYGHSSRGETLELFGGRSGRNSWSAVGDNSGSGGGTVGAGKAGIVEIYWRQP